MLRVEIRVKGRLDETWSEWFDGLTISHFDPNETLLSGSVQDHTAVFGVLARLRDLGLELNSVITDSC
jgi:hypothetical protein